MPELPEVETTRRHLAEHLPGARVAAVALLDARALLRPEPAPFAARVIGATILAVERRAKYLIVPLRRAAAADEAGATVAAVGAASDALAGDREAGDEPPRYGRDDWLGQAGAEPQRYGLRGPRGDPSDAGADLVPARGPVARNTASATAAASWPAGGLAGLHTAPSSRLEAPNGRPPRADDYLIVHRRMTGNLFLREPGAPPDGHTVVVFSLDDGRELRFCDMRRFAKLWLADAAEVAALDRALGPEPLTRRFTAERLADAFRGRRGLLKPLLLNQNLVAGLGNIYVDEALFAACLHPTRTADTLTDADFRRLHRAIRAVLAQGIRNEGTSFRDYRGAVGQQGRNQMMVEVFRREGQPCPRCRTIILKTRVGGRGTHYCPRCQR